MHWDLILSKVLIEQFLFHKTNKFGISKVINKSEYSIMSNFYSFSFIVYASITNKTVFSDFQYSTSLLLNQEGYLPEIGWI